MEFYIDLRSDTVTKPCEKMRECNLTAMYGDDVNEEDTTVKHLESEISVFFGKEDALFFPTGTMANLTAILCWCEKRGSEIIVGNKNHIYLFEQGGASQFGGVSFSLVKNLDDGTMDLNEIENSIRDDDIHEPITSLIAIENTHNACGGKILPIEFLRNLRKLSQKHNLPIHLDGARLWNALQEYEVEAKYIVDFVDSFSVCLSKGLGAPMGSLLVGNKSFIKKARRIRKALGGGMRQTGFVASAGLIAFENFKNNILKTDHDYAQILANRIDALDNFELQGKVQTNIFFVKHISQTFSDKQISDYLKERKILVSFWDKNLFRIVIHKDIQEMNISYVASIFTKLNLLLSS